MIFSLLLCWWWNHFYLIEMFLLYLFARFSRFRAASALPAAALRLRAPAWSRAAWAAILYISWNVTAE
jgi:hypothetical protein